MADLSSQNSTQLNENHIFPYHVPVEYKIVDLPVIQLQVIDTIKIYPCKLYRKALCTSTEASVPTSAIPQTNPTTAAPSLSSNCIWKRKCYGRIKFIKLQGKIVIAAFEYNSCHKRLSETPIHDGEYFKLSASLQYENNWIYKNKQEEEISIALNPQHYNQFKQQWENAKDKNSNSEESQINQDQENSQSQLELEVNSGSEQKNSDSNKEQQQS